MKIEEFLENLGFKNKHEEKSQYFGDFYKIYEKDSIEIKLVSSKSKMSIDIRPNHKNEPWYDLALVKSLFYQENRLNQEVPIADLISFLESEINKILHAFSRQVYHKTKTELENLGNIRARQMFPNAFN